jgi:hypothetical protein
MNVASSAQLRPCGESGALELGVRSATLASETVGDGLWVRITGITGDDAGLTASGIFGGTGRVSGFADVGGALALAIGRLVDLLRGSKVITLAAKLELVGSDETYHMLTSIPSPS